MPVAWIGCGLVAGSPFQEPIRGERIHLFLGCLFANEMPPCWQKRSLLTLPLELAWQ